MRGELLLKSGAGRAHNNKNAHNSDANKNEDNRTRLKLEARKNFRCKQRVGRVGRSSERRAGERPRADHLKASTVSPNRI